MEEKGCTLVFALPPTSMLSALEMMAARALGILGGSSRTIKYGPPMDRKQTKEKDNPHRQYSYPSVSWIAWRPEPLITMDAAWVHVTLVSISSPKLSKKELPLLPPFHMEES